jgi:hypothetical protein
MDDVKPEPFDLFAQYHLGILPDGTALFQNANQIAARYGVDVGRLNEWLRESQIDAETADGTDYDLPARHGAAQVLAMEGDRGKTLAYAFQVYDEYRARLGHKKVRTFDPDEPAW